jgi:hypothetical protein
VDELAPDMTRPAEGTLYEDPATADLGAKVSQSWDEFARALAPALVSMPDGAAIDLTLDPTATGDGVAVYAVTVAADEGELRAYAVSNAMLAPADRLSRAAVADLVALGWLPPGVVPGSLERLGLSLPREQAGQLAKIVTRTLREIYGTPHPAFLVYTTASADGASLELPPIGAARPDPGNGEGLSRLARMDLAAMPLPEKVAAVIAAMMRVAPDSLPVDNDGDIGIRSGSAMVFVRVRDSPPLVDVFSPVLTGVNANERLYQKLSELTHRMPIGRLYFTGNTVWASVPVFGRDFQHTHLMLAVEVMTGLADELDDKLQGEFGGKRFFVETDLASATVPASENGDNRAPTGMYL